MKIAVDFDGTIVENAYPSIGHERPFAISVLKRLIDEHHELILWTVREGALLDEAVEWCSRRGVEFYAINRDYPEEEAAKNKHFTRKLKVDLFIDDRNLGGLPDWGTIYTLISNKQSYEDYYANVRCIGDECSHRKDKKSDFFKMLKNVIKNGSNE